MVDVAYELVIDAAGNAVLTCGGEVMWTSDNDDEFAEKHDLLIDFEDDAQLDEVIAYLVESDYLPPDTDIDVVPAEESL